MGSDSKTAVAAAIPEANNNASSPFSIRAKTRFGTRTVGLSSRPYTIPAG